MTINGLIKKLIQEVLTIDYKTYQNLILKKNKVYNLINEGKYFDPLIQDVKGKVLLEQIKFFSYYSERIPRIEKIIILLEKSNKRVSKHLTNEYKQILGILNEVLSLVKPHLLGSNILSILEEQRISLEKNKFKDFNKLFKKEAKKLSKIIDIFRKLNINEDYQLYSKLNISRKKLFALKACIGLILLSIVSSYFVFAYKNESFTIDNINSNNLSHLIQVFEKKDLEFETQLEQHFENLYGANILGEYTELDIQSVDLFTKMYGKNILRELRVKSVLFLPPSKSIKSAEDLESHIGTIGGRAFMDGTIILVSGKQLGAWESQEDVAISIFLHELSHIIHFRVMEKHPEFNSEWEKIKGGYLDPYQTKNIYEDVASLNERVLMHTLMAHIGGRSPVLTTIDGKPESLQRKVELLKEYGFFPKTFDITVR